MFYELFKKITLFIVQISLINREFTQQKMACFPRNPLQKLGFNGYHLKKPDLTGNPRIALGIPGKSRICETRIYFKK